MVIAILAGMFLVLPNSLRVFRLLVSTIVDNFGASSSYGSIVQGAVQYSPPSFGTYLYFIGPLFVVLSIFGAILILTKDERENLPILILLIISLIFSLGSFLHIYIPTDRLQAYLFIPVLITSMVSIKYFFNNLSKSFKILFVFLIFLFSFITLVNTSPWFALWHGEIEAGDYLNLNYKPGELYYLDEGVQIEFLRFEYPLSVTRDVTKAKYVITKDTIGFESYRLIRQFKEYYLLETVR